MIYLDHAAATPVSKKVLSAMLPYFSDDFFNPSSPYLPAKRVREAYESAKDLIAHSIGAKGTDLVITSGATESINLAFTVCRNYKDSELLVSSIEHTAALETAKNYPHKLIPVDSNGRIDLTKLKSLISDRTVLISVCLANNELGTIEPLSEISEIIRNIREDRLARGVKTPLFLHSDASQATNLLDINVSRLGTDLLTISAAKCNGPKGVGALYLGHGVPVSPLTLGGGQEKGLRSGTENVAGVIGFATAISEAKSHLVSSRKTYQTFRKILISELKDLPGIIFLGNEKHQLANFLPISFPGLDAERLIYKLEDSGVLLSTGAACAANKGSQSHVLKAIGLPDAEIAGSLRISLGSTNTERDVRKAARLIRKAVLEEYERIGR